MSTGDHRPPAGRIALALQRFVSATDRGLPRRAWTLAYELVARGVGLWLARGEAGAAVHVRGSVAHGDALHGVSDIDLIVVVPGDPADPGPARRRVQRRWRALERRLPALAALVTVGTYEARELREAIRAPAPTWPDDGALFARSPYLEDALWLRTRPGVHGPATDWRRLRGPAALPAAPARDAQDERVAAWLELQWWWRHAIAACSQPDGPRTRYLLVKFVAEPLRLLLWLEHRERVEGRRRVLEVARERIPGEEAAVDDALRLLDALPRRPAAPVATMLPHLVRLSARVAATIGEQLASAGADEIRLAGAPPAGEPLPLADWRALAVPPAADERFVVLEGSLADPGAVAAAASTALPAGAHPALRAGDLLAVPLRDLWRSGFLRTLQSPLTDPVSFALLERSATARFPRARGWSLPDVGRRAVAERRGRLDGATSKRERAAEALGLARAALLLGEEPVLPLTLAATAEVLADRGETGRGAGAEELAAAARRLAAGVATQGTSTR